MTHRAASITITLGAPVVGTVTTVGAGADDGLDPVDHGRRTARATRSPTTRVNEPAPTSTSTSRRSLGTEPPSTAQAAPGHVRRALGAEEGDHRGHLVVACPCARSAGSARVAASTSSRVEPVRAAIWSARPPSLVQSSPSTAPGRHRVHEHAPGREGVREHPAERELRGLRDRVGRVEPARRAPARGRAHVHDPPAARRRPWPGASARISRIGAITCSSHCSCQSASVRSSSARARLVPALFTSAQGGSGHACEQRARRRRARSRRARGRRRARATVSTRAPSCESMRAVAAPIPRVPPVTTQTLPSRPRFICE